jgi:glutamate-5-semialdehyde dehydrogenase
MTDETGRDAEQVATAARSAAQEVAPADTERKNAALEAMARNLSARRPAIIAANRSDVAEAQSSGLAPALVGRLGFDGEKIDRRVRSLRKIIALPDPVGRPYDARRCPNGLTVCRMRVPLGVVLMVYEARPHVTVNGGAFCLKSGNAAILRGGSEARRCNALLGELWQDALCEAGLPRDAVQVISGSHEYVGELLQRADEIDLVIPRGGPRLIEAVAEQSCIPVIKHCAGVCHVYLDDGADMELGTRVALDSKCLMPGVCNAMETLLVARPVAPELPRVVAAMRSCGVTVVGCEVTRAAVADVEPATEHDWQAEYLDMKVSVRVVEDVGEAIEHINRYGSHHTDAIVTESRARSRRFVREVDSAVVLVNASTMFCDGESLGMGAEIGISTDRLHARGPMGLEELTTYKFVVEGDGQVMGDPSRFGPAGGV